MRFFFVIVVFVTIALIQVSIVPWISPAYIKPNLLLMAVVCWGTMRGVRQAVAWGAFGGILLDIMSSVPFGINLIALLPVSLCTGMNETKMLENTLLLSLAIVFVGTFIYGVCFLLIVQATGSHVYWVEDMMRNLIPSALVNTLLTPLMYWFLLPLSRWAKI